MRRPAYLALTLVLAFSMTAVGVALFKPATTGTAMAVAANAFLASLSGEEKGVALQDYDSPKRVDWHFIPKDERKGLKIGDMSEDQRKLAYALLKSALSDVGYDKTTKIMDLENLLKQLQKSGPIRDPYRYYVTIFGEPKADARWGFSFEGHHLSLNFVVEGNKVISSTPQALCTNPAELKENYSDKFPKGYRILKLEETIAFELVNSLSADQAKVAVIAPKAPAEIRNPGQAHAPTDAPVGVAAKDLSASQQQLLRGLIDVYCAAMPADVAEDRLQQIEAGGFDKVHFAWAGATKPGVGHYYRVQGPSFVIELVNTQPDVAGNIANHVHCIFRDMAGDFALPIE
ncbi:DUF3500 domain-containing protein [Blastopirellula sp. JC732]|uniref:DUF3500 domain-containing protein n=1 Tax=Blastopirellula sediminis TaxID=2894196 RepID=A0A9X1SEN9_9BACT|nr:DUF3500 domain-containing protein [Blastopirellula sediminis]MCC9607774.1 DUF3500 domain-containing protein [Blastopirellula sediminis]MCC9627433.1 DUF3500 domain-containing protein [Blastopirellula sediminis]